ncbi:MAG: serpin family protein [Synergistaceae bacterium]|nr:serpin family protein [Synergistaceae bacterium]
MRYFLCLLLTCLSVIWFSPPGADAAEQSDPAPDARVGVAQAADAVNAFAVDLYGVLAEEEGNLFFSPYSISSVLAMTYAGAKGDTGEEMAKALRFTGRETEIHAAMKSLQDRFDSIPDETGSLSIANRLWLDRGEKFTPDYEALTREYYGAGAEAADFSNAHESVRLEINDWVAQKTRDRIKDLLQVNNVTSDTKLVLVNAIYFDSAWLEPFDKALTMEEPFRTGKDEQHNVSMMRRTGHFLYGENSDAQWLKIPYRIPRFSMLILLPRKNSSFTQLRELEKKLTHETLASWTDDMSYSRVTLRMPKFKDERRYSLSETLKKLGMNLAFTNDADFSGMVEEPRKNGYAIHIDFVVHKAFIELDEEKTEAAAATAVGMTRATAVTRPEPIIKFNADHPFIYCLMDDYNGVILFMGRMERP